MNDVCLSTLADMHASNSGGRTPESKLPASPPPLPRPDGGGQPWPCTCAHGPKKTPHQLILAMMSCHHQSMNCNCGTSKNP